MSARLEKQSWTPARFSLLTFPTRPSPAQAANLNNAHQGCTPSAERDHPTFALLEHHNPLSSRPTKRIADPKEGVSHGYSRTSCAPQPRTSEEPSPHSTAAGPCIGRICDRKVCCIWHNYDDSKARRRPPHHRPRVRI